MKVLETRSLFAGPSLDKLEEFRPREISDSYDAISLRSEEARIFMRPHWTPNGKVFIRQIDPLPITITAIVPEFSVG